MKDYCQIELDGTGDHIARVSPEDWESLSRHKWRTLRTAKTIYARRHNIEDGKVKTLLMHREIMKPSPNEEVDHLDGDGLDNRRHRMRLVSHAQNGYNTRIRSDNTSGHKGVIWCHKRNMWEVRIWIKGKVAFRCYTRDLIDGAQIYALMSFKIHGEHGRTR